MMERFKAQDVLRNDYFNILNHYITPLVSCQHLQSFYGLISQVFDSFISFDEDIAGDLVKKVLMCWPESKPSKQLLFINLINFLMERVSPSSFKTVAVPVFSLYARCARACHAKVATASFEIWQNVQIIPKIIDSAQTIFPIVFTVLNQTMKDHWNVKVQNAALNCLKSMHELDPFVFDELTQAQKKAQVGQPDPNAVALHKNWATVARTAARVDRGFNLARILADIQVKFNVNSVQFSADSRKKPSQMRGIASSTPPPILQPGLRR